MQKKENILFYTTIVYNMPDSKEKVEVESLLDKNKVLYSRPPSTNIVINSTHHVDYANCGKYNNATPAIFDSSISGNSFVSGRESYLRFDVSVKSASADKLLILPPGGACGLIQTVVISSRNVELSRTENFNILSGYRIQWEHNEAEVNSCDAEGVISQNNMIDSDTPNGIEFCKKPVPVLKTSLTGETNYKTFCIPMRRLSALFDSDQLLPPQLLSSLRMVLSWTPVATAFSLASGEDDANFPTSFTINNPRITWKTYTLADQYARKISEITARQGLYLPIFEYFNSSSQYTSSQVNFRIEKSCSRAVELIVVENDTTLLTAPIQKGVQPLASKVFSTKNFQAHLGPIYYPVQRLETTGNVPATIDNITEFFQYSKYALGNKTSLSKNAFFDGVAVVGGSDTESGLKYRAPMGLMAVDLRLNNQTATAGVQINSAVSLLVDYSSDPDKTVNRWLKYVRLINIFSNNIKVEE